MTRRCCVAQGRGNEFVKDFKQGLGLSHVPTGSLAANQAYFLIAALAWNLKTWMLNLLQLGDGAVLRFKRFLYLWICQAGIVATTGRGSVLLKLPAGEYYQRFGKAFVRLAALPVHGCLAVSWQAVVCPETTTEGPFRRRMVA